MKKKLAAMLALCIILCSCGRDNDGSGGSFYAFIPSNPANLDPQLAVDDESVYIIKNIFGGLMENDPEGRAVNGTAEFYRVSDDGLMYTFAIRDDIFWNGISLDEPVKLTAYDYEFAFRRIFTAKNRSPYTEMYSNIKNSMAYYNGECSEDEFGVHAESDKLLIIELEKPDCDFLQLLTCTPAMPCNEKLFNSTRGRYGLSARSVFSCGAFYMTDWNYDPYWNENYISLEKISSNSQDNYKTYPDNVEIRIGTDSVNEQLSVYTSEESVAEQKDERVSEYQSKLVYAAFSPENPLSNSRQARLALASVLDRSIINGELSEECKPASRLVPEAFMVSGTSYRYLIPDMPVKLNCPDPKASWDEFCRSLGNAVDVNSYTLLVHDNIASESLPYSICSMWENKLDFYCTPVFEDRAGYDAAIDENRYDICIFESSSDKNLIYSFFNELVSTSNPDADMSAILSGLRTPADIASYAKKVSEAEEYLISEGFLIPLYYQSRYLVMGEDTADFYYDPFTSSIVFKYAKQY